MNYSFYDLNGDQHLETGVADRNADGRPDALIGDQDGDGYYESSGYDADFNGTFEHGQMDTNRDGFADVAVTDADADGWREVVHQDVNGDHVLEYVGLDTNRDGFPESTAPSSTTQVPASDGIPLPPSNDPGYWEVVSHMQEVDSDIIEAVTLGDPDDDGSWGLDDNFPEDPIFD